MSTVIKKIECVAIRMPNGIIHSLPRPNRHHHVLHVNAEYRNGVVYSTIQSGEQGFLLDDGTFVDRVEAGRIAIAAGQIKHLRWPPRLYSEDLW